MDFMEHLGAGYDRMEQAGCICLLWERGRKKRKRDNNYFLCRYGVKAIPFMTDIYKR